MANITETTVSEKSDEMLFSKNLPDQESLSYHWMPFTMNRDFKQNPRLVVKADGMYYWSLQGKKILDGCAGLFTCNAGHNRKEIREAVSKQLADLDYSPHFNLGHPLSFQVAKKLCDFMPEDMNKVFFGCSGSEAIDTSMKLVSAYWLSRGEGRRRYFVSREHSYHGVNIGGTNLAGISRNRSAYNLEIPCVVHMRHTKLERNKFTPGIPLHGGEDLAEDLERFANLYGGENIAACYVEPVAGSIGCYVPPKGYLQRLREICDKYKILLVFDEVITGFGRTGSSFAVEKFGVKPDIVTLAKALTNGNIPMSAVLTRDFIYNSITNHCAAETVEFSHGYTFSAHPVALAAASATLDIYAKEGLFSRGKELEDYFAKKIFTLRKYKIVVDIRSLGFLAGIDLLPINGKPGLQGKRFNQRIFDLGLHLKITGDTMLIAPPLILEKKHIDELVEKLAESLQSYE